MNRLNIYLLTLGTFLTATSELVVAGILPAIAADLHITIALAGQLITVYSLAFAIGTPIFVALTSRMGRKHVLVGALAAFILGCLLAVGSTQYEMLLVSRLILGVSAGVYLVVAFGSAVKFIPAEKTGSAIGTIILGFSSAMVLGVPIGIAITNWFHWQAIFTMLAILSLLVMFLMTRHLPQIEGDVPVSFKQQFSALGSIAIVSSLFVTFFREAGNSVLYTCLTPFFTNHFAYENLQRWHDDACVGCYRSYRLALGRYRRRQMGNGPDDFNRPCHSSALPCTCSFVCRIGGGRIGADPHFDERRIRHRARSTNLLCTTGTSVSQSGSRF